MKQYNKKRLSVYLWLLSFLKPHLGLLILFVITGVALILCEMAIPFFIQFFIDKVIVLNNSKLFFTAILCLIAVVIIMFAFIALDNILRRILPEKVSRDLQYSVFRHLRVLGFSYFERKPVGETLSLLNTEVLAVQDIFRQYLPASILMVISLIFPFCIITYKDYRFALIIIGCYLLYFTYGPYMDKKVILYLKKQTHTKTSLDKKTYDSVSSAQEVRAYNAEEWDLDLFVRKFKRFKKARLGSLFFRLMRPALCIVTTNLGNIAFFIFGSILVKNGQMTVGEFTAYIFYFMMVMRVINGLSYVFTEQMHLLGQAEKLYDFMKTSPDIVEISNPKSLEKIFGNIKFKNVSFSYPTRTGVLNDFSLEIKPGERVAFVGTSGSGKSTALKLIDRFYDPEFGEITLDGIPLKELSLSQMRKSIGYVFQETYLFGTSIKENIRFGNPDASDEEVIEAAKAAYAHDFIMETEHQYDTLVGERGIKLSGGQKQRIALARMFISSPSIILLDEATSALDNVSESYIKKALDNLSHGRTTIAVAHRISTIMDYDRIILLKEGRVAEAGTYDELVERKGLFYNLLEGEGCDE